MSEDVTDREADWRRWKRGVAIEALAKERGVTRERMRIRLAKMDENMTQLALLARAEQAEAERDAAFAAGQEAVVDWLDGFDTTGWDDREAIWAIGWVAELVRESLPIKPRP